MMHQYHDVPAIDRVSAEKAFASGNAAEICNALVSVAFYEADWRWAQDTCLGFLSNADPRVSGLAATCLGHIARIHRQIDKEKVVNALRDRLSDSSIAGQIEDALNDIEMFVRAG